MATIQVTNIFIANTRARAAEVNRNFTDLVGILSAHHHDPNIYTNAVPITNSGIAANAQILDTQLKSPITRSGLIDPASIKNNWPAGSIPATAFPLNIGQKRVTRMEFNNTSTYVERDSATGELAFTDSINGTKRISQFSAAKFGGNGTDGALSISSGTTTIAIGSNSVLVKNYSSISITGTGVLAFSGSHTNGTVVILKSQGSVTLTSSATPMIDCSSVGGSGGAGVVTTGAQDIAGNDGVDGKTNFQKCNYGKGYTTSAVGGAVSSYFYNTVLSNYTFKYSEVFVGGGGGSGRSTNSWSGSGTTTSGAGGAGGGGLIIECNGDFNFTTTNGISVAGGNGGSATSTSALGGGGGGGGGGFCKILYNSLTSNTGTINVSGGIGGNRTTTGGGSPSGGGGGGGSTIAVGGDGTTSTTSGAKTGGDGAVGISLVGINVDYA